MLLPGVLKMVNEDLVFQAIQLADDRPLNTNDGIALADWSIDAEETIRVLCTELRKQQSGLPSNISQALLSATQGSTT